jgi:hypothetical protein
MKTRSTGLFLTGLFLAGIATLVAPGCGRSILGECNRTCDAICHTGDDCENETGIAVDLEECIDDCHRNCLDVEDNILDECGNDGVEIRGENVDDCIHAYNELGAACRDGSNGDILDALDEVGDQCDDPAYECN